MSPNLKLLYRSLLAAATLLTLTLTIDPQTAIAKPDTKIARADRGSGIFGDMAATDENHPPTTIPNRPVKTSRKSVSTTNIPTRTAETNTASKKSDPIAKSRDGSTEVDNKSKSRPTKKSIEIATNSLPIESKSKSPKSKKSIEIAANIEPIESMSSISEIRSLAEGEAEEIKLKSPKSKKSIEITVSPSQIESRNESRSVERKIEIEVKSPKSKKVAMRSPSPYGGNHLRLVRYIEDGTNEIGNPIYTLEAYIDGELKQSIKAVSGTATTQKRDRHVGENAAPLPDGIYQVSNAIVPGSIAEVGRTFIAITPQFSTGRTDLGIHLDPSYNQRNGRDGTAGCIGITNALDRDAVNTFIAKYQPRNLYVNINASK
jgi:hypothetical protein